jgi:N-terminal acetyltransferase B complex non-catalytic subunit
MAKIYARQNRLPELFQMWKSPPAHLTAIMEKHPVDISILKVELLTQAKQWSLLEEHASELIEDALALANKEGNSEPLRQLCASRWDVWKSLIEATSSSYPKEE